MRFCDKLPKLRKENNLSQEQLADKLGVSRQAISKWESGASYPDMDKMLQMCTILNCTLENLMDDGKIGNSSKNNSKSFMGYLNDLLSFITRAYNMFCSMTLKEKVKCFIEMTFIAIALLIVGLLAYSILDWVTYNAFDFVSNKVIVFIERFLQNIYALILIVLGIIIFIHLFKIRYLDYFVTIEDENVSEKTIEQPVDKKENNNFIQERKKEKIIIRDPKHSVFSFMNLLGKIILIAIKVLALMVTGPVLVSFVFLVFIMVASICHVTYSSLFWFIAIMVLGCILVNYVIIELMYRFIFNQKQALRRFFIMFITGLIMAGFGFGVSVVQLANFEYKELAKLDYKTDIRYIDVTDKTYIHGYMEMENVEYVIDNSITNAKVEVRCVKGFDYDLVHRKMDEYDYYYIRLNDINFWNAYNYVLDDIKNKRISNYDLDEFIKIKIFVNQENYDKLNSNLYEY